MDLCPWRKFCVMTPGMLWEIHKDTQGPWTPCLLRRDCGCPRALWSLLRMMWGSIHLNAYHYQVQGFGRKPFSSPISVLDHRTLGHGTQAADSASLTSAQSCLPFCLVSILEQPSARAEGERPSPLAFGILGALLPSRGLSLPIPPAGPCASQEMESGWLGKGSRLGPPGPKRFSGLLHDPGELEEEAGSR
ncbi:uncharacterized protein LOC131901605 isoform X2 [Peromyscus eremicus]|uniref:uncharacterized protein LOC131901605 isoform X2 n=1 Tax=Peromyscus eremicus TaxID=42410 RepID=UPI0027DC7F8C|nr:uncharacterized protein LOC131901605 isoform X2 [Peromyscus eremicus]